MICADKPAVLTFSGPNSWGADRHDTTFIDTWYNLVPKWPGGYILARQTQRGFSITRAHKCRDVILYCWTQDRPAYVGMFHKDPIDLKAADECMRRVEGKLGIANSTVFHTTTDPHIVVVKVPAFWARSFMRMHVWTWFLRVACVFYQGRFWPAVDKAFNAAYGESYLRETKAECIEFLRLFMRGNTLMGKDWKMALDPMNHRGIFACSYYQIKAERAIKDMLVAPASRETGPDEELSTVPEGQEPCESRRL